MLAKIACVIATLSVGVDAQFTNPIGSGPASGLGYMLMNTMPLPPIGNYSIGYLPAIGTVAGGGVTDMPACRRIQMFKFPALLSGTATMITMNTLPGASAEVCDVGFNLYTFSGNQQVGTTYIGAVSSMGSTTSGSPGNGPPATGYEVSSTLNVSSAGWYMTNGTLYYLTIQPSTYNSVGGACNIRLPYGMDTTRPPRYAVVTQQGPIGQPCGVSPWTTVGAIDGGYIHMSIAGVPFTSASPSQTAYLRGSVTASPTPTSVGMKTSASPTGTVTPTSSVTPTGTETPTSGGINPSGSDTPTGTDSPSVSSSQTPTPSSSSSPSASASSTVTPTQTSTWTQSQGMSISNTPTSAPMPVATASVSSSGKNLSVPIDTPLAAAGAAAGAGASAPVGSIVGGIFAAIVVVAVIGSVVAFNLSRTVRAQVGKYTGIKDARSPVTSSQSVIVMNPAGNAVSVYHNSM